MTRLADKVDATHRVIAESELRLGAKVAEVEQRLNNRIAVTERRFVDLLNERFDAVMIALDRLQNPPR